MMKSLRTWITLSVFSAFASTLATGAEPTAPAKASSGRRLIKTSDAPAAIGPYSQAVLVKDTLYISGQLPLDPKTGLLVAGDIRAQTRQVLANLTAILAAAGFKPSDAVQTQVFLTDMNEFAAMNEVYAAQLASLPARATIQVGRLAKDARVEISMIAVKDD